MWLTILWALYSTALKSSCHKTTASNHNSHAGLSADSGCYSQTPKVPAEHWPEIESCFTFLLFTSVWGTISSRQWNKRPEVTAAAWDSTLNWAQLQCCKNSARHQLISPVFFVFLHSCNCWVPPHSLWRGGFIFLIYVKAELHFPLWNNAAFKLQKSKYMPGTICAIAVPVTESLYQYTAQGLQKSCTLVKYSRKSVTENIRNINISIFNSPSC